MNSTKMSKLKRGRSDEQLEEKQNEGRSATTMPKSPNGKRKKSNEEFDEIADSNIPEDMISIMLDSDEISPFYTEVLQLQEALMSSASEVRKNKMVKLVKFSCEICMEEKSRNEMFNMKSCSHSFCLECISKHIAVKIQQNINSVTCPGLNCDSVLDPEDCRPLVPEEVFDRWMHTLCESFVLGSQKFYCPFKDCSAMLVDDGEEVVRESECPNCRRLFCAQCKVPWHSYISCEGFRRLNEDERGREDIMLMRLAGKEKWRRCPSCKFYVEKKDGCLHITCRCEFQFCYRCGATWTRTHGGCQGE